MPTATVDRHYRIRVGPMRDFWTCRAPEVCLEGPAGTGKTLTDLLRTLELCEEYPGIRVLACRKTRASMTESVLVTFEQKVLSVGHPALAGPDRAHRSRYDFPNGSCIVIGGLDHPERTFSTEYDLIIVFEATETTLDDCELMLRALRNGRLPWQQLVLECNPDQPLHWINQRCNAGQMKRIVTRHRHNPYLWSAKDGTWTKPGEEYMQRLQGLSGVRRKRLLEGVWCAAEGQVWENWDADLHLIDRLPPGVADSCYYVAGVDWGFTNAGVITVWAVDKDRRVYCVKQVYRRGETVDWWTAKASELRVEYRVRAFICDPSQPAHIKQFKNAGNNAKEADNEIMAGLDAVRDRLVVANDGRPRLFVLRDSLESRDRAIAEDRLPCCLEEEIPGYVYPQGVDGKPIKEEPEPACPDHACDTARYVVRYVDRYDLHERRQEPKYGAGTIGAALGHE